MARRNLNQILAEKYDQCVVVTEAESVRRVPFTDDEKKILAALYDFELKGEDSIIMTRIAQVGTVERVTKYSDNSYVLMIDDSREIVKQTYEGFYELVQALYKPYKANSQLDLKQTPAGPDEPYGIERGG